MPSVTPSLATLGSAGWLTNGAFTVGARAYGSAGAPAPAPAPANPLRFAGANNYLSQFTVPMSGTLLDNVSRVAVHLAGATTFREIRLCAYWFSYGADVCGNAGTLTAAAIEIGGVFVPVFWGGSRSLSLADGATDQVSDAITATSLGFPGGIPAGTKVYIRSNIRLAAAGNFPGAQQYTMTDVSSSARTFVYNRSTVTTIPGPVDATGDMTYTVGDFGSGALDIGTQPYVPVLLGVASTGDVKSFMVSGDSIAWGSGDTAASPDCFGFVGRAMWNAGRTAPVAAMCNAGWLGTDYTVWTGAPLARLTALCKYAQYGIDEYGTNSVAASLANTQTGSTNIWAAMRAQGITKIIRTKLMTRCTPGSGWPIAEASQVITAGWDVGQNAQLFNTWLATQVGSPTGVEVVVNTDSVRGTNPNKWGPTMTDDGTHPNATGYASLTTNLNAAIVALP